MAMSEGVERATRTATLSRGQAMPQARIRVAIIIGSVREGRFGPTVADWFADVARNRGDLDVDLVDLADYDLPARLTDKPSPEVAAALAVLSPRLADADAFVLVTPEYNHSYPASVKIAIDWHTREWHAKPVGFVSYGGHAGGMRAVEHLRPILAELHATTVRDTVSLRSPWRRFDERDGLSNPASANAAAKVMLDQLTWWAIALKEARTKRPYLA
jgi:NAD(P)H-dependent FMN reductase